MMLAVGLLLVAAQWTYQNPEVAARAAMIDSESTLELLEACVPDRPSAALSATRALRVRHDALRREATGLLPYVDDNVGMLLPPVRCRGRRDTNMQGATAAVDRFAAAVARRRAAMRGLWLGPLHLCAGTVLAVEETRDEQRRDAIQVRFAPAMAQAVARETTQRVRTRLPIVLDGRTLDEPTVNEPILGGIISLAGGEPVADFEGGAAALQAAANRPCDD